MIDRAATTGRSGADNMDMLNEIERQKAAIVIIEDDIERLELDIDEMVSELADLHLALIEAQTELKDMQCDRAQAAREMKQVFDPDMAFVWWYVHGDSPVRYVAFDKACSRHQAIMEIVNECELDEQHIIAWPFRKSDYRRDKRLLQRGA